MLPMTVDALDLDWLNAALRTWTPSVRVTAIRDRKIILGTATKILVHVEYERPPAAGEPPEHLCIKGGFDESLRPVTARAYQSEAHFYAHVARGLDIPLPRCWFAAASAVQGQGIVILDDLNDAGARFTNPLQPWSADTVAAALETQARWHARTWGATQERYPWYPIGTWVRDVAETLLSESEWQRFLLDPEAPKIPTVLQDRERMRRALFEMWRLDDLNDQRCLVHSDAHMGNTFGLPDGRVGFVDWQALAIAPPMDDVSNIIGGSMTVADRRANERMLLQHYLDLLVASGGPRRSFDEAWLEYRRYHMHGILWPPTPSAMQHPDRTRAMSERHVAAIIDHDVLQLLES
ncbi:MAG: oxidoreductase family protein [Steroidobacteraceae bacterium]